MKDFIRIEQAAIPTHVGRAQMRYFVDLVSTDADGSKSSGNLASFPMRTDAVRYARSEADRFGLVVESKLKDTA